MERAETAVKPESGPREVRARTRILVTEIERTEVWDLCVSDEDGECLIEDAARSEAHVKKLIRLIKEYDVSSLHVRCILEDLLADVEFIE